MPRRDVVFFICLIIITAIALVVFAAIQAAVLGWLLAGVIVLGAVSIILARVGVDLFSRYTDSRVKVLSLKLDHTETMAKLGYQLIGGNYQLLPPPPQEEYDIPISTSGIVSSNVDAFLPDAVELGALSAQWHRGNNTKDKRQLAPYSIAKQDDYFKSGDGFVRWQNAMAYFCLKQIATEDKTGNRSRGTFVKRGTAEQAYQALPHPG